MKICRTTCLELPRCPLEPFSELLAQQLWKLTCGHQWQQEVEKSFFEEGAISGWMQELIMEGVNYKISSNWAIFFNNTRSLRFWPAHRSHFWCISQKLISLEILELLIGQYISLFLYVTRAGVIGINPSISGKYKTFLSHNLIFHSIVLLLCWSPSPHVSLFNVK